MTVHGDKHNNYRDVPPKKNSAKIVDRLITMLQGQGTGLSYSRIVVKQSRLFLTKNYCMGPC